MWVVDNVGGNHHPRRARREKNSNDNTDAQTSPTTSQFNLKAVSYLLVLPICHTTSCFTMQPKACLPNRRFAEPRDWYGFDVDTLERRRKLYPTARNFLCPGVILCFVTCAVRQADSEQVVRSRDALQSQSSVRRPG